MTANPVFLDTGGLLSLWDNADQWHALADEAFRSITERRRPMVATPFVLLECGNAAARRPYRARIGTPRRTLEQRQEVIAPIAEDWAHAWGAHDRGEAAQAGIVDLVLFVVMQSLGLKEAYASDQHSQAAGFTTLY